MKRNSSLFPPGLIRRFPLLLALSLFAGALFLATPARAQLQVDPQLYKLDGEPTKDGKGNTVTKYKAHKPHKGKKAKYSRIEQTANATGRIISETLVGENITEINTYNADGSRTEVMQWNNGIRTDTDTFDANGHRKHTTVVEKDPTTGITKTGNTSYTYNQKTDHSNVVRTEVVTTDATGAVTGKEILIYGDVEDEEGNTHPVSGWKEDGNGKKISKYNPDTKKFDTISMATPAHDLVKPGFRTGSVPVRPETQPTGFASNFSVVFGVEGRGITDSFQLNTLTGEGHDHHGEHHEISPFVPLYEGEPRHFKNATLTAGGIPGLGVLEVKSPMQLGPAEKLFSDSFFDYSRNPDKSFLPGQTVDLHALVRSCCSRCISQTFSGSDYVMGVSPDVALVYHLASYCWFDVDIGARYSYMNVDDNTGWQTTGFRATTRTTTSFTGFQSVEGGPVFVVTNPAAYNATLPGISVPATTAPFATKEWSIHPIRSLAISNVYLHEAALPITLNFLGNSTPWGLFYTTGITLEVPYCDETIMTQTRHGMRTSETTDTPVKVGMMNELGVSYKFTQNFAVEFHAGYTYAGRAKVTTSSNSSTNVNTSSPTFGLDFKYRF